jgi:Fur family peroxide stress response transcriptional regulator
MEHNSKQRRLIYETVLNNRVHPTAEYIYNLLKGKNPRLSLGTVYRNLGKLADGGKLLRLHVMDGPDRFDWDTNHHYHCVCEQCGKVLDIYVDYMAELDLKIESETGLKVKKHSTVFTVVCEDCAENKMDVK